MYVILLASPTSDHHVLYQVALMTARSNIRSPNHMRTNIAGLTSLPAAYLVFGFLARIAFLSKERKVVGLNSSSSSESWFSP